MSEQFTFHQCKRNSSAVDGNERAVSTQAIGMDGTGDQFFTCTAFSVDQDGGIRFSYPADLYHGLPESGIFSDNGALFLSQCLLQRR